MCLMAKIDNYTRSCININCGINKIGKVLNLLDDEINTFRDSLISYRRTINTMYMVLK